MTETTKSKIEVAFIYLFIGIMFIIIGYPLFWAIMMSLNSGTNMLVTDLFPKSPTLEHYKWLFTSPKE